MLGRYGPGTCLRGKSSVSVKVVRERSDQRRHHRVTAPLFVEYAGHRQRATDWSLGGLRLDGFPGDLPEPGSTVTLTISIPFQGFDVRFSCDAEVVRKVDDTRTFAVKYTKIGERELGLLDHFIDELIRGSMNDVNDTIQRIDVPVTPASTKPDVNPLNKVPISRWPTRTVAFVALYLTIGLFVFGYAGVIAYTNFVRMEVDSAVIASPLESVRAQVNGRIAYGRHRIGDRVTKGALLLSVTDNDLERQIDLATIDIKDKSAQLASFEKMLAEEMSRVDAFAKVEGKNLEQIELELQSLEAQAKAASALHQRLDHLFKQGLTTATQVESAEKQMVSGQKLAEAKRVELKTRRSLAAYNAGERLYNGQTFFGERAKIESQTFLAREHVAIAERKLQALLDHRDRLAVYAPYDGVLQEMPRPDGSMVRAGDTLAVIENPQAREIWAFLRQDEVLSVGLGDEVKVYLPGLSELRKAKVKRIDRTIGFVNEMNSTYVWRAPRDRSAKVVLEFVDVGTNPQDESYRTGMPAVAIFSTRPTNYLVGDMMHRFRMVFGGRPRKSATQTAVAESPAKAPDEAPQGRQERVGPPTNYEAPADPIRGADAVTARRQVAQSRPQEAAPAVPTLPPVVTPDLAGRAIEGLAGIRERVAALVRGAQPSPQQPVAERAPPAVPGSQSTIEAYKPAATPVLPPADERRHKLASDKKEPAPEAVVRPQPAPVLKERAPASDPPARVELRQAMPVEPPIARPSQVPPSAAQLTTTPAPVTPALKRPANPPDAPAAPVEKDRPEPEEAERAKSLVSPPSATQGFFARLAARLRSVLAIKPPEDEEDWGDGDAMSTDQPAGTEPEARGDMRALPSGESALPPSPKMRPAIPPSAEPSLREPGGGEALTPRRPAPAPQRAPRQTRGQTTAAAPVPIERPLWQERLRRAHLAERTP